MEQIARRLEPEDVAVFRALRMASLKDAPDNFGSTYEDWQSRSDAELRGFLEDEPIFAAFVCDQPVGLTGLIPENKSKQAHRWGLAMVYVSPEARGGGAANALMSTAVAFAIGARVLQLELSVNATNARAIRFYERHGFQITGQIPRGYRIDGGFADEVMMVRFLDC
jgi:ribosomal protein S18 acetylase RimI-like enzyme